MTNAVRRVMRAGAVLVLVALAGGGCASHGTGTSGGTGGHLGSTPAGADAKPPVISSAAIRITPDDGALDVPPADGLAVKVAEGTLTDVRVAATDGGPVTGALSPDRRTWRPDGRLNPATRYTVDAYAVDGEGRRAAKHAAFSTLVPRDTLIGFFKPEAGSTVGTGMIVSLDFNRPVTDRAAVGKAVTVTAEPPVPVTAHWFGDRRLDFRPETYWAPGTTVTLSLRLRDVEGAPGVYGTQSKDVRFAIGRDQVSTVDAAAHTMTVRRGGTEFKVLPVTAGAPGTTTYNGRMVISEKLRLTRMNGDTVGFGGEYDIPDVSHAMRLTRTGTFIHGNYWAPPEIFGTANTSHGCIGLPDAKGGSPTSPAGWLFDHSLVGDVVEVVNSHDRRVDPDNGLSGWNMSWQEWGAGSFGG